MSEWKECKLGDVCEFQEGYVNPSQNFSEYFDGNIKWLRATDLNNGNVYNTSRTLTEKGFLSAGKSAKLFKPNTIGISKSGTIGRLGILKDYMCGNRAVINIAPSEKVNTQFIYYNLLNRQDQFEHLAVGSVQKNLYVPILAELKIKLPSLSTQNEIAKKLSALDDKIELNNQINRNLEEQAQALFKNWFIDFEPFGGVIPSDWENGKLSDLGTIVAGGTPSKARSTYYTDNGIAWITPKDLSLHPNKFTSKGEIDISQEGYDNSSAKIMPKGTVLFSSRAPIGYISIAQNELCTNQGFKSVIPKVNVGTPYVYFYLKNHTEEIENKASGSTFKEASGSLMNGLEAIIPSNQILSKFNSLCNPIFEQQESLELENQRLVSLRDNLLPKLMSGEIDVADVRI